MQLSFFDSTAPGITATPAHRPVRAKPRIDPRIQYQELQADRDWLESQAEELPAWVLFHHLCQLADPMLGDAERKELLNWLMAETTPPQPFSFIRCARAYDPRIDPATLRDLFLAQLRRQGLLMPPLAQAA